MDVLNTLLENLQKANADELRVKQIFNKEEYDNLGKYRWHVLHLKSGATHDVFFGDDFWKPRYHNLNAKDTLEISQIWKQWRIENANSKTI